MVCPLCDGQTKIKMLTDEYPLTNGLTVCPTCEGTGNVKIKSQEDLIFSKTKPGPPPAQTDSEDRTDN